MLIMCHFNSPALSLWTSSFGETAVAGCVTLLFPCSQSLDFILWRICSRNAACVTSIPLLLVCELLSLANLQLLVVCHFNSPAFSLWTSFFVKPLVLMLLVCNFNSPAFSLWTFFFGESAVGVCVSL